MRKLVFVLALTGFSLVHAQDPEMTVKPEVKQSNGKQLTPDEKAKRDALRAEKSLGLNEDQKSKWETAAKERIVANRPLKEKIKTSSDTEKKELRQQMMLNNKKFDETVVAFLTPDQKTKWEQQKAEKRQHRRHRIQKQGN